jgi:Cu2+-exporting ATPase
MISSLLRPRKKTLMESLLARPSTEQVAHPADINGHAATANRTAGMNGSIHPNGKVHASDLGQAPQAEYLTQLGSELSILLRKVQQTTLAPLADEVVTLYQSSKTQATPLLNALSAYLTELDGQWQMFVHTRIDPLLGGARSQQLGDLGIQMSPAEKEMNRRLILAVGNIGLALAATNLFLPLAAVNIGFIAWIGMPLFQRGYRALVDERRLTYPIILFCAELTLIFGRHFVPSSVIIFVVTATNKIINRTEDHFRRNIVNALGQQPRTVWLLVNGVEVETPLAAIRQGDVLVIGAGEMIAVDGVIVAGAAMIDQHRLTGEAQPSEKTVGDPVLASTVVLSGKIQVQVQKTGTETAAAQIAVILQRVARTRLTFTSRVQNFVDGMTLPMLAVGGTALLTLGTQGAAAVMSVGVGSVARFGGPLAMLNYLNVAARHGLLIKDARSFEILKNIDTIIFDKTGTLTLEQPYVSRIHLWQQGSLTVSEEQLLSYAAAAESKQTHPIAKAIMTAVHARGLTVPAIEDAHLEVGYGIKVQVANVECGVQRAPRNGDSALATRHSALVRVGSHRFMEMEGIAVPPALDAMQEACHAQGHSLVFVAIHDQVAGAIELQPTIRPEAQEAIATLRTRGLDLYIISGDHQAPTQQLAQTLGIERYFAGVLPQDKASLVEQLKAEGRKVCFVGDGINDGLALGKADVSISLRGASTLATDTAQVVLMSQDLRQLEFLLQLAHEFDQSLNWLFRLTLIPVSTVAASTFLLHTGIYTSLVVWQLGVLSGISMGFLPLLKHPLKPVGEEKNCEATAHQRPDALSLDTP